MSSRHSRFSVFPVLLSALLALPGVASANSESMPEFDAIRTQQSQMRADAAARVGRYKDLPEAKRIELIARQDMVLRTIEGKRSAADLSEQQRLELFNALEWIEATVNRADEDRLVCERRKVIGSTRRERVCKTAAQMREDRERAREQLDRTSVDKQMTL